MNSLEHYFNKLWQYCHLHPYALRPQEAALYSYAVWLHASLGYPQYFGLPTTNTMLHLGVKKYESYNSYFKALVNAKLFFVLEYSKNQYTANVISLLENAGEKKPALPENGKANSIALPKSGKAHDVASPKNGKANRNAQIQNMGRKQGILDAKAAMRHFCFPPFCNEKVSVLEEEVLLKNTTTEKNALPENGIAFIPPGVPPPHIESFKTSALHDIKFTKVFNGIFVNPAYLPGWLTAFNDRLHFTGDTDKTELGYRNHFIRWLVKVPDYKIRDPATYEVLNHTNPETSNITPTDQYFLDLLKKSKTPDS